MAFEKKSDSIVVFANSAKRSSGITPQFTINLTRPITQIKSFEILGVEVPYSFYNVWKGNVGIGEITDNGNVYTLNHGNLGASDIVPEGYFISVFNYTLMIKIDNREYRIPALYNPPPGLQPPNYIDILYSINNSGFGISCVLTIVNYKLSFAITTTFNFSKIGFYLNGTTVSVASYIGLTEDVEMIFLQPTNTATLLMPTPYKIFDSTDYNRFTDYVYAYSAIISSVGFLIQAQHHTNYYSSYSIRKNNVGVGLSDYNGTMTIDVDRHYISYIIGFNSGSYSHLELAPRKLARLIKPPKYYENRLLINVGDGNTYGCYVPDGYYTPTDLAANITAQFALQPEISTSTVTASSTGIFTIIIRTANPHNSIQFIVQKFYGWNYLIFKMGFEDQFVYVSSVDYKMEVTGVNITSATFVGSKPFNYKPTHLYIRSEALAQLTSDSVSFVDDPTYKLDNIIHKVGINTSPGGVITDDQKYQVNRYITHPLKEPITQLDFSLYDEDGQLVQLNGRSWSIGIKIEF